MTSKDRETIRVATPRCVMCGNASVLTVDAEDYQTWKSGTLIQKAFIHQRLSASERELLMTGTHDACWDKMFKESDYDETQ